MMELAHLCGKDGRRPRSFLGPIRKSTGSSSPGGADAGKAFGITEHRTLGEKHPPFGFLSRWEGRAGGPPGGKTPKVALRDQGRPSR